jgi:signal transduction histidine kinase
MPPREQNRRSSPLARPSAGWDDSQVMAEPRNTSRIAWVLASTIVVLLGAALVFLVLAFDTPMPEETFGFRGWGLILATAFGAAGLLIASRVPANPIGWILLLAGTGTALQELATQYSLYGLYDTPGAVPRPDIAAWIVEWIWIPYIYTVAFMIPLVYPTGRLPSPRWRPVLLAGLAAAAVGTACFALMPGPLDSTPVAINPFGIEGATWIGAVGNVVMLVFAAGLLAALGSIGVRYRRSRGDERQQLKWLLLALSLLIIAFLVGIPYWTLGGPGVSLDPVEDVVVLALISIPVSIGIAILKYRLYEIDVVIKKTVVYAILAILLFVVGVVPAWAIGGLVVDATGSGEFSWLVAGLLVGVGIWPLRRLATRIADRLVFGRRATPYQVLSEFSDRVAETYAAEDVLERMARVLAAGVGATGATVWLGAGAGAHPAATWPSGAGSDPVLPGSAIEVRHQGEALGALSVRMPVNDPMTPTKERLIRDLAGQAGLVLRNAKLIEDLRASRQRLVAAQDEERRRIERNIHDGAQQQLVALAVKLGLVERQLPPDADRAAAMLSEAKAETNDALETLRDLARGIYPPLLADQGLGAALGAQSRKASIPVTVDADGVGRFAQDVEAAVYFSCLEALQNVAKHAGAEQAWIRLGRTDGDLTFEVRDDGRGFDPAVVAKGTGLQGIADRLAAIGGEIEVRSAPGDGTTLVGRVPLGAAR